ncbi:MAG: TetR/AcrR family transcriptional regulator [Sphingomonadales bacterium]|jgi:AcrR family transcriptional regulator|nr:TetR/AcrR family transcriptional regulator [Sphingomonadales bacterium]WRH75038.1 MAG: TetR/AcrR family transcriptional regulator [Sphingobium sp.]
MDVRRTPGDLREACLAEALAIIEQEGLEKLSLRDVARRLGVSHQAPYRHFPSRDHVLAEIVRRAYADFAAALRSAPVTDNPAGDSLAMGFAYVQFALSHPLQYRLMFGGALPDPHQHSEMMHGARDAFDVLRHTLGRVFAERPQPYDQEAIDREAMFVWSSLHGLVSLLRSDALNTLELSQETRSGITMHALQRIGFAVGIIPAVPT